MNKVIVIISVAALAVFSFAACSGPAANSGVVGTPATNANTAANANSANANAAQPGPGQMVQAKSGSELYAVHCMTCHKDSGKGGKVTVDGKQLDPDDLTSANMKAKTDEKLYSYISDGVIDEGMPAFKNDMTPEEIRSVVAHLRTLQAK